MDKKINMQEYNTMYNDMEFYHTFYLNENKKSIKLWDFTKEGNDIIIYGQWNHNDVVQDILDVINFSNKTVIDVACRDGFYSYLAEKQENIVTAIDFGNLPARKFIHSFLNSNVEFIHENINGLYKWTKKFQVSILGDILVHLENPLGVLKIVRNLTTEKIVIISDYIEDTNDHMLVINNIAMPYIFSIGALKNMLMISGFKNINIVKRLELKCPSNKYNWPNRKVCIITADIDVNYKFDMGCSSYYSPVLY